MYGYHKKLLEIHVGQKEVREISLKDDLLNTTLGGKGLAIHLLSEKATGNLDPFSPENPLIILGGPVTGTQVWGSCRHGIYGKSPLTGLFGESYSGGTLARSISAAGVDGIIVVGKSHEPLWLEISSNGVTFHDASWLWGKLTFETEQEILSWLKENRKDLKFPSVATIGPAGENLVRFALVANDLWRSAGRTGMGALMGSKGIKAIAFWGNRSKEVADPTGLKKHTKAIYQTFKDSKVVLGYRTYGTPSMVDAMDAIGALPSNYWRNGKVPHKGFIDAEALHTRMEVRPHACLNCFMACGRLGTVKEGPYKDLTIEGPEYETIYAFGALCGIRTIEEIAHINKICDGLGMDTISAGNIIGLIIEASKRRDFSLKIEPGDTQEIGKLLLAIAHRNGIGEILGEGIQKASEILGIGELAVHVKGMEPAGYDPRVLKGMALAYATSPRGACHLRSTFYKAELLGLFNPEDLESMVKVFVDWEDRLTLMDTMIFCRFYRDLYPWETLEEIYGLVTGSKGNQLRQIAKRISDEIRLFNLKQGMDPSQDWLPKRFFKEALPETGEILKEEEVREMIRLYYSQRGWNHKGQPKGYV